MAINFDVPGKITELEACPETLLVDIILYKIKTPNADGCSLS